MSITENDYLASMNENSKLQQKNHDLECQLKSALFIGAKVDIGTDELTNVCQANNCNNVSTEYVFVKKQSLIQFIRESGTKKTDSEVVLTLNNQIKKLEAENDRLKKSQTSNGKLEQAGKLVNDLRMENNSLKKQINEKINWVTSKEANEKHLEEEIAQKDEELLELRKQLAHANEELAEFKNKKSLRSEKHRQVTEANRQKAVEANKRKGMNTGALILAYHFDNLDIEGIIEVMRDYNCINVGRTLIYNTLSVRKDEDRERILNLYKGFPDYFSNVSEEELIAWFEKTRIKKLHLITRDEFIERFGEDKLPDPDKYVSGEYYSQPK